MSGRPWAASLDMYRKVPADLLDGTKRGSCMSLMALFAMVTLFIFETQAYFSSKLVVDLALDTNTEPRVRVNFNITMMDLRCEFAVIDVVSVLGTDQNVTQNVARWSIDGSGIRQRFQGRNKKQNDVIKLKDDGVTETLEELHENGEDAVSLDAQTLQFARNEYQYVFVDFFASWCSHCRDLAPTWETLAEVMNMAAEEKLNIEHGERIHQFTEEDLEHAMKVALPVLITKIDCVDHKELCAEQGIRAYPTLRLFINGERSDKGDYRGHRTVVAMTDYLKTVEEEHSTGKATDLAHAVAKDRMDVSDEEKEWTEMMKRQRTRMKAAWKEEEHPGCQLAGFLMVDRAPGNFHIQARSPSHDLVPHMTNVSHIVHTLSIGEPYLLKMIDNGQTDLPPDVKGGGKNAFSPMNGNVYVTNNLHEAYHHYLKVVSTNFERNVNRGSRLLRNMRAYQILQNSQLSFYRNDVVPEAKFAYDLSPISVSYRRKSRHWYDYLTSLMAIIGGTFTVVGMLESSMHVLTAKRRKRNF